MRRALPILVLLAAARVAQAAELEVAYGHEQLTRGADWRELSLGAAWGTPGRPRLDLSLRGLERFEVRDAELRAAVSAPVRPRWILAGEASASAERRFLPAFAAAASLQRALGAGFVASAGVRSSSYESPGGAEHVAVGWLGLERYWDRFRAGWTGYVGALDAEWSASNAVACDLYYGEGERVGLRLAAGREIESAGAAAPIVSTVLAAGVTGRHGLGRGWAVVYDAGIHRQGDLYTRTGARLGLRRHF